MKSTLFGNPMVKWVGVHMIKYVYAGQSATVRNRNGTARSRTKLLLTDFSSFFFLFCLSDHEENVDARNNI